MSPLICPFASKYTFTYESFSNDYQYAQPVLPRDMGGEGLNGDRRQFFLTSGCARFCDSGQGFLRKLIGAGIRRLYNPANTVSHILFSPLWEMVTGRVAIWTQERPSISPDQFNLSIEMVT